VDQGCVADFLGGPASAHDNHCVGLFAMVSRALAVILSSAVAVADGAGEVGCCFSIGYGDLMRPCCLSTKSAAIRGTCHVGDRIGGASGFSPSGCPESAHAAAKMIADARQQVTEQKTGQILTVVTTHSRESRGCCYSIGYGDFMKPCCLTTDSAGDKGTCKTGSRMGGATGFSESSCPKNSDEAAKMISAADEPAQEKFVQPVLEGIVTEDAGATPPVVSSAARSGGCCYSIGFGAEMVPCCLSTMSVAGGQSMCANAGVASVKAVGGASGYADHCPVDAAEAATWVGQASALAARSPVESSQDSHLAQVAAAVGAVIIVGLSIGKLVLVVRQWQRGGMSARLLE